MATPDDVAAARVALAASEARLLETLSARLTDAAAREPSFLPDWTRGHVVTHIARNAESNALMIEAALRGEERPQYTSGPAGRAADIEVGAQRSAAELVADARLWADRFADVVHSVGDDQWDIIVQAGIGPRPIRQRVFGRRNEVEVHHVDLDLGYLPAAWPDEWVVAQLRRNVELIPERYLGGAPAGTWSVIADGVGAWTFGIDADVVSMAEGAASDAHATATGPPYAVHAWLLGRQDGSELEVAGDPVIRDLPRYFPWA